MNCVICGEPADEVVKAQPEDFEYGVVPRRALTVLECPHCKSRFLQPRPSVSELIEFYPLNYHAYNEDHGSIAATLVSFRSQRRAKAYQKLISNRPVRIFDVGAGDCRHFDDLARFGEFYCAGIELKPELVDASRKRGYEIYQGTLEELDTREINGTFDIVTMYQLVEHVIEPSVLLKKAFDLLRPGGFVLGQLPCMDSVERQVFGRYWAGYHYPRHLQMLTKNGMRSLLQGAGFQSRKVTTALHLQAAISLQNVLVGKFHYGAKLNFGKTPIYSLLLLAAAPFCIFEFLLGRGGMMNFQGQKPS